MKQILLLTDFSESSIDAIHYALNLFKDDECDFYVLYVESSQSYLSDNLVIGGGQSIYDSIVKKSKQKLSDFVNNLQLEYTNTNFTFHKLVDYDGLTEAINQVKTSKSIELIVMGSNGVTGAKETVFGSNTVNVIRDIDCPTLVIPKGYAFKKLSEVLLPLDFEDKLNSSAFLNFIELTKRFINKMHVLRIVSDDEISEELENDYNYIATAIKGIETAYNVVDGVPMEYAVSCYTQTHAIDLIALLVQKENFLERIFKGSSTAKISNTLRVPLLVLHS
jgi:nucleotide-binding universal stress UspA family protein